MNCFPFDSHYQIAFYEIESSVSKFSELNSKRYVLYIRTYKRKYPSVFVFVCLFSIHMLSVKSWKKFFWCPKVSFACIYDKLIVMAYFKRSFQPKWFWLGIRPRYLISMLQKETKKTRKKNNFPMSQKLHSKPICFVYLKLFEFYNAFDNQKKVLEFP